MPTFLFTSGSREIFNHLPDDSFSLHCGVVGDAQRRVIRHPNIQIKPILNIFGKELGLKPRTEQAASDQENQGSSEDCPTVFYGLADKFVIEAVESSLPSFLNRRFSLCGSAQNVVAEERNKRHRNKERAQQRSRHHDRKALRELASITR